MRAYGYCRVSTQSQAEDGESLDVQKRKLKGYAQLQGLSLERVYVERGVSGTKPLRSRHQGRLLLEQLEPGDSVIASKLDRIFRSAKDALETAEQFKGKDIRLHLIDLGGDVFDSGVGKLFFTMVAAFAEFESARISERISDVKADQRSRSRYLGGNIPFGYTKGEDGELVSNADQQRAMLYMRGLRKKGWSYYRIATAVHKKFAFVLSHMGVKKILNRAIASPLNH